MKVLVNGGAAGEFVMRKRHVCRVEIASLPTWQPLNEWKTVCIHKRHGSPFSQIVPAEFWGSAEERGDDRVSKTSPIPFAQHRKVAGYPEIFPRAAENIFVYPLSLGWTEGRNRPFGSLTKIRSAPAAVPRRAATSTETKWRPRSTLNPN